MAASLASPASSVPTTSWGVQPPTRGVEQASTKRSDSKPVDVGSEQATCTGAPGALQPKLSAPAGSNVCERGKERERLEAAHTFNFIPNELDANTSHRSCGVVEGLGDGDPANGAIESLPHVGL